VKVGDLVMMSPRYASTKILGLITERIDVNSVNPPEDPLDLMFPYFVCFNDCDYNDWYGQGTLEVINENR